MAVLFAQRIPRYRLLLETILQHTAMESAMHSKVEESLSTMGGIASKINADISLRQQKNKVQVLDESLRPREQPQGNVGPFLCPPSFLFVLLTQARICVESVVGGRLVYPPTGVDVFRLNAKCTGSCSHACLPVLWLNLLHLPSVRCRAWFELLCRCTSCNRSSEEQASSPHPGCSSKRETCLR